MIAPILGWLLVLFTMLLIIVKTSSAIKKVTNLYFLMFLITSLCLIYSTIENNNSIIKIIASFWIYTTFSFVLIHSSILLGNKKTLLIFIISLSFGLLSEVLGVKYGWIFGTYYYYSLPPFFFGLVPLMTPISWAVIIYMSYTITNIILRGLISEKPNMKKYKLVYIILFITLLSSIDGLVATNLDMIIDPVSVAPEILGWIWIGGGPYYGIPISNFVGWFLVTFSATFIFRFYESLKQKEKRFYDNDINNHLYEFTIIILYVIYFFIHASQAIKIGNPEYVLIGATTMGPFILITILTLVISLKKNFIRGSK